LPGSTHQLGGSSISIGGKNLFFENIGRELLKWEKSSTVFTEQPSMIRTHVWIMLHCISKLDHLKIVGKQIIKYLHQFPIVFA